MKKRNKTKVTLKFISELDSTNFLQRILIFLDHVNTVKESNYKVNKRKIKNPY